MAKQENVMRNVKVGDIAIVVNGGYKRERDGMFVNPLCQTPYGVVF
jgi:hypothetical protein